MPVLNENLSYTAWSMILQWTMDNRKKWERWSTILSVCRDPKGALRSILGNLSKNDDDGNENATKQ